MDYRKTNAPSNTVTRDMMKLSSDTGNVYETVAIIGKRANQISVEMKQDLEKKLQEFASYNDNLEEVFENREQIFNVLSSLEDVVKRLKDSLSKGDHSGVHEFFDEARLYRDSFSNITPGSFVKRYEIVIDVLDKPGSIAIISVLLSSNNINIKNMSIVNNRERENGVLYVSFDSEQQRQKSISLLREMNYEVQIKD